MTAAGLLLSFEKADELKDLDGFSKHKQLLQFILYSVQPRPTNQLSGQPAGQQAGRPIFKHGIPGDNIKTSVNHIQSYHIMSCLQP